MNDMDRSNRLRVLVLIAAALLAACGGNPETRVQLTIVADAAWELDDLQLRIGDRAVRADILPVLELVLPDEMGGEPMAIEVWGLALGEQRAYGTTIVTPTRRATTAAMVTLTPLTCGLWCELGTRACDRDGVTECRQAVDGCLAWSPPMTCSADTPYCSNGACSATCTDECTTGATVCDSTVASRGCGQFDGDSCLDWSPAMACPSGQACSAGTCGEPVTCAGDGDSCDDGNPCTVNDTCGGGVCAGSPKCTSAPARGKPTCSSGTCGFACDVGFMPSGTSCVPAPVAPMPTARLGLAAALGADGKIYAIGGFNSSQIASVEVYDPTSNTWDTRASMPFARSYLAAAAKDGQIYALGGWDGEIYLREGKSVANSITTVEAYDLATDTWMAREQLGIQRLGFGVAVVNDRIYALGGFSDNHTGLGVHMSASEVYDPIANDWAQRAVMPTGRSELAAAVANGRIYAIGGTDGQGNGQVTLGAVEAYDPATNAWTTRASMPTRRKALSAVVGADGVIYAIGGRNGFGDVVSTVEAYDPSTNIWTPRASMPAPRSTAAAVVGPDGRIYVIGGTDGTTLATTVLAYDPTTDQWSH